MAEIHVLVTGYVKEGEGTGETIPAFLERHGALFVQPTVTLVRDGDVRLIVDPGILADVDDLYRALLSHNLTVDDITHVFVTHQHIDHTRNVGLFRNAMVYDYTSSYDGERWGRHSDDFDISPGIRIIQTPGHTAECASLVVQTEGSVVVMTHVWWFSDRTPEQDPLATNQEQLNASRQRILELADRVIPGHGEPFDVK